MSRTSLATPQDRQALLLRRHDAFALLIGPMLLLIFVLPARLVLAPLGAAGRPAILYATGLALVWLLVFPRGGQRLGKQPVRWLVGVYFAVQLLTYAAGFDRGLPALEARSADRWLLMSVAVAGLALFVADGVPDRAALDRLLRRVLAGGGVMALIGSLQFLIAFDVTQYLKVPGLKANRDLIGIGERGDGFARIAGTASHYIEFGVVLAMLLPLAIHYAFFARPGGQRARRWMLVALLGSAVPFSVSRSGVLGAAVAFLVLFTVWPWRLRLNALVVSGIAVVGYRLLQPGLLGTIKSLFTNAGDDPSVQGRTDDYTVVFAYIRSRPWFGRGAGTFMPERYILLDNQLLYTWVTQGIVGLVALLLLAFGAYWTARSVRLRGATDEDRHLAQALAAGVLSGFVVSITFDALSFTTFTCLFFLLIGCVGALFRLDRAAGRRPLQPWDGGRVASPWMAPTADLNVKGVAACQPRADILMITHRSAGYLHLSLPRLLATCGGEDRVWLWHNGDDEATLEALRPYRDDTRVHRFHHSRENVRLRPPTNWLWEASDAEFVSKVDDDCLVAHGWLDTFAAAHRDNPEFGVVGSWRHPDEDFRPKLAERKIREFQGGHRLMQNLWVQGSGYLLPRSKIVAAGLLRTDESFTAYCLRLAREGAINGFYYPFVGEDHMDDPRSPNTLITDDEALRRRMPLSAAANGVTSIAQWTAQLERSARLLQSAPLELKHYGGWRRQIRRVRQRIVALAGVERQW